MIKISRLRLILQMIFCLVIIYLGYLGIKMIEFRKITLVLPTLSCYYIGKQIAACYLRSVQHLLTTGWEVYYTNLLIPTGIFLILGLIFGRLWCGWVCPLGLLQDLFIRIRKFFKVNYYNLSLSFKQVVVIFKYILIFVPLFLSLVIGIPKFFFKAYRYDLYTPFCQICPGKEIFPFLTGNFQKMFFIEDISTLTIVISYLALGLFVFYLASTAFIRRMWCRLCPTGVLLGFLNGISIFSLRKEGERCTKCGICQRSCPVQIKEVYEEKEKERIIASDCILCFRCVEMCPEDNTLRGSFFKFPFFRSQYKRFLK